MEVQSRFKRKVESGLNGIKLIFDPTVRITKSSPTMDQMTLISNIGGCLGLTLGFSILQLVDSLDTFIQFAWNMVNGPKLQTT